jgi:hypothetical protein
MHVCIKCNTTLTIERTEYVFEEVGYCQEVGSFSLQSPVRSRLLKGFMSETPGSRARKIELPSQSTALLTPGRRSTDAQQVQGQK